MTDILIFYVPHATEENASRVVKQLVEEKLIACGNIFPIHSTYEFNKQICQENEYVSLLKTTVELGSKVAKRVEALHTYDIPCIVRTQVACNESYAQWLYEQTNSDAN